MMNQLITVDQYDNVTGYMDKLQAHKEGVLHRAFSVFVFNGEKLLIHQRALDKYHSGGLWTNTCCSHPMPEEGTLDAAHRRLDEEMGMKCDLSHKYSFIYKADVGNGLIEHELDHIIVGFTDVVPNPNQQEVMDWKWADIRFLLTDIEARASEYTSWFKMILPQLIANHGIVAAKNAI